MEKPIIKIAYNRFLDPIFVSAIKHDGKYPDWVRPEQATIDLKVTEYKNSWKEYGDAIVEKLIKIIKPKFIRTVIDVHIVSGNPRPFSRPIVLSCKYTEHEFLYVLTHELIHVLLGDAEIPNKETELYPNETKTTQRHVLVYAILELVGIFPYNLKADYLRAYEIVKEKGARKVLSDFGLTG